MKKKIRDIAEIAGNVYDKHSRLDNNSTVYLYILLNLASEQNQEKNLKVTATIAANIYEKSSKSEIDSEIYLLILYCLSSEQEEENDLKVTEDIAATVYKKTSKSSEFSFAYANILHNLALNQEKVKDLNYTAKKAEIIYNEKSSNEVIAITYLRILYCLALKQEKEDLKNTINIATRIYSNHLSSVDVIKFYGKMLVNRIRIEKDIDLLKNDLNRLEKLLDSPLKERIDLVVELISDIISNLNEKIKHGKIREKRFLKKWIYKIVEISKDLNVIENTNNGLLSGLLEYYKKDNVGVGLILKIYNLVLQIKFGLAVKEFPRRGFGHYTSSRTLHIHLNQEVNIFKKEGYKITSKSRLYNVDYMNDPEEGKILDRYLLLQKENEMDNFLEPSPWFLMCLTTAIDDLAMWSQYGSNAEGVFLELKNESFQLVDSPGDINWLSGKSNLVKLNNMLNKKDSSLEPKSEQKSEKESSSGPESKQESDKDILFRICYLDENELKRGNLVVSSDDVLLKKEERKMVTSLLSNLKEIIDSIGDLKKPQLINDIDKLLEEIRYLFKASGYKYEKELRVLRYATIESMASESTSNELIGIQYDSDTLAKPYLEREDPIQIKRVIFGPKFSRPEYVTPLIRLVDKDIEFTISERKFK